MVRSAFSKLLVCMCVLTAADSRIARSQPASTSIGKPKSAEALDHLAKGNKLYNVRSFAEAAEEYKAGALVESAQIFDYNLGQCYRQLGKYEDAIWHYQRFIKGSPQVTAQVEAATKFVTQMQDELSKKAMTAPPTEAAPTTPQPALQPTPPVQPPRNVEPSLEREPWYHDRLGLGLTVGGVVATGVATGLLISASSIKDQANESTSQRERNDLFDKADTRSTIGIGTMIGGGALLITGIVMLSIPEKRTARSQVSVGIHSNGVSVYGRF